MLNKINSLSYDGSCNDDYESNVIELCNLGDFVDGTFSFENECGV